MRRRTDQLATVGRYSILNPRVATGFAHLLFGGACLNRPNLDELFRSYAPFGDIPAWGVGMMLLGVILLAANRASVMLMIAHFLSAVCLWTIFGLLTIGAGPLPASMFAALLGCISIVLFARTFRQFLESSELYQNLQRQPPRWLEQRAWFQRLRERHKDKAGG